MKRTLFSLTLLIAAVAAISPGPAAAMTLVSGPLVFEPSAWLQVGNDPVHALSGWVQNGDIWYLNFTEQTNLYTVSGVVSTFGDPFISYGVAFTNNSPGTMAFNFGVLDPTVPFSSPSQVYASYSGSGTDVMGDGYAITPLTANMQTTTLNGNVNAGVDVGLGHTFGAGFPGVSRDLGNYANGPKPGPLGGPWTSLETSLAFNLSYNDVATLNGYSSITPVTAVPEPASLMLMGGGLIGMALVARRRRHARKAVATIS